MGYVFDAKMTPMIDVIFQLLIFFLCTAGFAVPEAVLPTELPRNAAVSTLPATPRDQSEVVKVQLAGRETLIIQMNRQPVATVLDLLERLRQIARISRDVPVILDVSSEVPIGKVIAVYDKALSSGLRNVHFAARAPLAGLESK
jgi:biopolymer transport protein ExbD